MTSPDPAQIPGQMTVDEVLEDVSKNGLTPDGGRSVGQVRAGAGGSTHQPAAPVRKSMTAAEVVAARLKGKTE